MDPDWVLRKFYFISAAWMPDSVLETQQWYQSHLRFQLNWSYFDLYEYVIFDRIATCLLVYECVLWFSYVLRICDILMNMLKIGSVLWTWNFDAILPWINSKSLNRNLYESRIYDRVLTNRINMKNELVLCGRSFKELNDFSVIWLHVIIKLIWSKIDMGFVINAINNSHTLGRRLVHGVR